MPQQCEAINNYASVYDRPFKYSAKGVANRGSCFKMFKECISKPF